MRFRTRHGEIRVAAQPGYVQTVTEEWAELHERFHKEAYAAGCISEDMLEILSTATAQVGATATAALKSEGDQEKVLQGDSARLEKVKAAIKKMLDSDEPKNFTSAGLPDLRVLRAVADFEVSGDERDEAWKQVQEEL